MLCPQEAFLDASFPPVWPWPQLELSSHALLLLIITGSLVPLLTVTCCLSFAAAKAMIVANPEPVPVSTAWQTAAVEVAFVAGFQLAEAGPCPVSSRHVAGNARVHGLHVDLGVTGRPPASLCSPCWLCCSLCSGQLWAHRAHMLSSQEAGEAMRWVPGVCWHREHQGCLNLYLSTAVLYQHWQAAWAPATVKPCTSPGGQSVNSE